MEIKKGDIFFANLGTAIANNSEQAGIRPVLIVSNNLGNKFSPTIIVSPLTTKKNLNLPTHVYIEKNAENGLKDSSVALLEQIRTIDKSRLSRKTGTVSEFDLHNINKGLLISLGI